MFDPVLMTILAMFAGFAVLDFIHQRNSYPRIRVWRLRGLLAFAVYLAVAVSAPLLWDAWLAEHRLFDLRAWPLWGQIAAGMLAYQLVGYGWHRAMHASDFLWRHVHQTHHSAERIDIWSAFWFHPLDMIGWTLAASLALVGLVGIGGEAALVITMFLTFMGMFTHANLRTPRWLGWIIARPEMHAAHHERGVHRNNYTEFPIIDMIFGTFHNPPKAPREAGLVDGGSNRLWSLLIGRKIA